MIKEVKLEKIQVRFEDTGRSGSLDSWKKLKPKLVKSLEVFQGFFWARGAHQLAREVRKAKSLELSITLCGKSRIQTLNRDYRQKDKPTDVLSFPVHDSLRENDFVGPCHDVLDLGDVFICREVAKKQAIEFGISYEAEVVHLLIHGLLHLCGYDHEISKAEEDLMFSLEDKLMKAISKE